MTTWRAISVALVLRGMNAPVASMSIDRIRTLGIALLCGVCVHLSAGLPANAAGRVALVVGNGTYHSHPPLLNPPVDAADVASSLQRLGFTVTTLTDANAAYMRRAIVEFGRAAVGSDIAIVFYAGHGMEIGGENWLIPVDAELASDSDVESEAVSLRSLMLQVSKAKQLGLVILDACRTNPFESKMVRSIATRAVARGFARVEPADNVLVAYAAKHGTVASDGRGRNSPFTTALLRNIEKSGLEITFLFRNIRDDVMAATNQEQQPYWYGSLSKDAIYLNPPILGAPKVPGSEFGLVPPKIDDTSGVNRPTLPHGPGSPAASSGTQPLAPTQSFEPIPQRRSAQWSAIGLLLASTNVDINGTNVPAVEIIAIDPNGPSRSFPIAEGDVIVAVAGQKVRTPADVERVIATLSPSDGALVQLHNWKSPVLFPIVVQR